MSGPLVEVRGLTVSYRVGGRREVVAVDGVDLDVHRGRTVGLVGESGSGKSSLGSAILGQAPIRSGTVTFDGADITRAPAAERRRLSRRMQVVFQDPYGSLNPARTVGETVGEGLRYNLRLSAAASRERVAELLTEVGLPADSVDRFPSSFSGGQRQRIAIARALALGPDFIVCDEPVSALDLSVQAQVLNLLAGLKAERGLSYLFVSHDLSVVRYFSDEVAVMFSGRIVELGPADVVATRPVHPYTRALLAAEPVVDPEDQRRRRSARVSVTTPPAITGLRPGAGCPYAERCPHAVSVCVEETPQLELHATGHLVACHRHAELSSSPLPSPIAADPTSSGPTSSGPTGADPTSAGPMAAYPKAAR